MPDWPFPDFAILEPEEQEMYNLIMHWTDGGVWAPAGETRNVAGEWVLVIQIWEGPQHQRGPVFRSVYAGRLHVVARSSVFFCHG